MHFIRHHYSRRGRRPILQVARSLNSKTLAGVVVQECGSAVSRLGGASGTEQAPRPSPGPARRAPSRLVNARGSVF